MSAAFGINSLSKSFTSRTGVTVKALENVSMDSAPGELTCVLGPTGSGKSTLLRLMAGLDTPDSGSVLIGGQASHRLRGKIGYMTQENGLLPWLTVEENVGLPLTINRMPDKARKKRVKEIADSLGLRDALKLYPYEMSGGMQRRAALGRLMALGAPYWLLDEPFTNLDERTQHGLQSLLLRLSSQLRLSVVFVTHSVDEAVWLADRVVVLSASPGRVVESFEPGLQRPRQRLSEEYGSAMERIRRSLESVLEEHTPES